MEQLYDQIVNRFERVQQVIKSQISSDRFRILKEEERVRCQKESFILSMMRANKTAQAISKHLYYKFSYEIMKKINPDYQHELNVEHIQQNFINNFVGLYRHFFTKYEEIFNFKQKIQNIIRPTNHNLIIDLVKYLVDFSRDYYQQTFFWYMKNQNKVVPIEEQNSKELQDTDEDSRQIILMSKKAMKTTLNQIIFPRAIIKRTETQEQQLAKKDPQKNYQVLDIIVGLSVLSVQPKDVNLNIQVLKIRINDMYREMKSRNLNLKNSVTKYYNKYFPENCDLKQKQYTEIEDESLNRATHPVKMVLMVQKSGFNYINCSISENRHYCKNKEKKLSPLKMSQRLIPLPQTNLKGDYMLTSLRVIRISDSFLPSLGAVQSNIGNSTTVNFPAIQSTCRLNLVSSNSAANEQQIERRYKKNSLHQNLESIGNIPEQKIGKKDSLRKLNELKRSFKSEQKKEVIIINPANDPEKKIYDWLQKLRQIKEIERRKIMGLN